MRTTLAQVKASRIPSILNIAATDSRFIQIINEAQWRLLNKGKWWGTVQRIRICATSGCVTWPRTVAVPEAVMMVDGEDTAYRLPLHDFWYEFLEAGPGLQDDATSVYKLVDREHSCTFTELVGTAKQLRLYPGSLSDVGKTVLVQGLDENENEIFNSTGTARGEAVTLASPYTTTTNYFSRITGVQKQATAAVVRMYAVDAAAGTLTALGFYDPDETVPWYRKSKIVGLDEIAEGQDCASVTVIAEVKLEYIPASVDSDYMLIGNIPALKDMAMAVLKYEKNLWDEGMKYEASAIKELENELSHYRGQGALVNIRVDPWLFGGGTIESAS